MQYLHCQLVSRFNLCAQRPPRKTKKKQRETSNQASKPSTTCDAARGSRRYKHIYMHHKKGSKKCRTLFQPLRNEAANSKTAYVPEAPHQCIRSAQVVNKRFYFHFLPDAFPKGVRMLPPALLDCGAWGWFSNSIHTIVCMQHPVSVEAIVLVRVVQFFCRSITNWNIFRRFGVVRSVGLQIKILRTDRKSISQSIDFGRPKLSRWPFPVSGSHHVECFTACPKHQLPVFTLYVLYGQVQVLPVPGYATHSAMVGWRGLLFLANVLNIN